MYLIDQNEDETLSERMHMTLVDIIMLHIIDFLSFFFSCWDKSTWSFYSISIDVLALEQPILLSWSIKSKRYSLPFLSLSLSSFLKRMIQLIFFNWISTGTTFHTIEFENAWTHYTYVTSVDSQQIHFWFFFRSTKQNTKKSSLVCQCDCRKLFVINRTMSWDGDC